MKTQSNGDLQRVVTVSGGFDPVHVGHIKMFKEAKALGDVLVVILNNDNWLMKKKGFVFMPEKERLEIVNALSMVDKAILTKHEEDDSDVSVSRELKIIRPDFFANGGDRKNINDIPEAQICKKLGINMVFNIGSGGKIQSSSELVGKVLAKIDKRPLGETKFFNHNK